MVALEVTFSHRRSRMVHNHLACIIIEFTKNNPTTYKAGAWMTLNMEWMFVESNVLLCISSAKTNDHDITRVPIGTVQSDQTNKTRMLVYVPTDQIHNCGRAECLRRGNVNPWHKYQHTWVPLPPKKAGPTPGICLRELGVLKPLTLEMRD